MADSDWYEEGALWLHGGPGKLTGGRLTVPWRRVDSDSYGDVGIYLCKQADAVCPAFANGYALNHCRGKVYFVRVHLKTDEVYDSRNIDHVARIDWSIIEHHSKHYLRGMTATGKRPALPPHWAKVRSSTRYTMVDMLLRYGFKAMVLTERTRKEMPQLPRGQYAMLSLMVFDEGVLEIVKEEPSSAWKRT